MSDLRDILTKFVDDVRVWLSDNPDVEKDVEKDVEHALNPTEPPANIAPEPETTAPAESSVPADPTPAATEPPAGATSTDAPAPAPTEPAANIEPEPAADPVPNISVETFSPGDHPAESVSDGVTEQPQTVVADPQAAADAAQAEANAHPSVSADNPGSPLADTPPPADVQAWLDANDLQTIPKPA